MEKKKVASKSRCEASQRVGSSPPVDCVDCVSELQLQTKV
jgi:hypothetical protein